MSPLPAGLELRPLPIPASLDAPDAADFVEMVRVRNLVYAELLGSDDLRLTPAEILPAYVESPDETRLVWVVVLDGEIVGRVGVDLPHEPGSRVAYWIVELLRAVWGRGIGSAAYDLVERTAREYGRTVLQAWAQHTAADGPQLEPPTGFGRIPRDHVARFFLAKGYRLEQIERMSTLDLTDPALRAHIDELSARAQAAASGYRVVQWSPPTPREFVAAYAWMKSRMITDAPAAGLEFDEETWDDARVQRHDKMYLDAGRPMLVTAAEHIATGELVAFNELVGTRAEDGVTHQEDTLVLAEHRGHRLGMLVKCAGLRAWYDVAPHSPRVLTYNAEENRPMLDINEALGFVPIAYEGAWKKELDV